MKQLTLALLLGASSLFLGCTNAEPGAGSNTNWLKPCDQDAQCGDGLSCLCGVCTAPCDGSCPDLPNAICAAPGSAKQRAQCGDADAALSGAGMCLPLCSDDAACDEGQFCSDGGCVQLASADDSASSCVPGARLELTSAKTALAARYGTLFADALYLPVAYDERPTDWTEPALPAAVVARVTTPQGDAIAGCGVRFLPAEGSGSAFADSAATDENGEIAAYWVAGAQHEQALSAVLVDAQGKLSSQTASGTAYANDEGPQSADAARAIAARPATVHLRYDLPETASAVRVVLSAATFPHHAFYSAVNIAGFFGGLQNTSDLDALSDEVPDADRVLIASVWNLPEGDAQQLFGVADLACGPHAQELGGIRCMLGGAWQPGQDYLFELQRSTLAQGESGSDYAALGYVTDPCASSAGCTDYTLLFGPADAPDALERVVAYRYQSADISTSFGSFIQPYSDLPAQNSCLFTPEYSARFLPFVQGADVFEPVLGADFSATYASWHNEVCANYAATPEASGFLLTTGGPRPLGRPELPDEPARALELP